MADSTCPISNLGHEWRFDDQNMHQRCVFCGILKYETLPPGFAFHLACGAPAPSKPHSWDAEVQLPKLQQRQVSAHGFEQAIGAETKAAEELRKIQAQQSYKAPNPYALDGRWPSPEDYAAQRHADNPGIRACQDALQIVSELQGMVAQSLGSDFCTESNTPKFSRKPANPSLEVHLL